jgi:iron uptake system component EfeO
MRRSGSAAAIGAAALLAACASNGGGGGTTIDVTLQEWAVVVADTSAPAGDVTFEITNNGPEDVHEFVIFRTDLDVAELPTDESGVVDEEGEGIEVVDEVEDVAVGATEELTVTLEAGNYALVCNIYDEDEGEAHYAMGMRTPFTVGD